MTITNATVNIVSLSSGRNFFNTTEVMNFAIKNKKKNETAITKLIIKQ